MKLSYFLIFFSIVLTIYGLVNYYIFVRGFQAIPADSALRSAYIFLFLFVAASFIAGRFLERAYLSWFSDVLVWVGSFWLGAMLYFFLLILFLDIIRLANHFFPLYPKFILANYAKTKEIIAFISIGVVSLIIVIGHINALAPRIRALDLDIPKSANGRKTLNIVSASDLHLGTIVGRRRLDAIADKILSLKPDIVIFPGDILDEDLAPVIRENIGESLKRIKAPLGVYAITGNHEYIGGVEAAAKYLTEHDIVMLRDSVVKIDDSFYLIGREDRSIASFARKGRKPLEELLASVDRNLPIILLDHQPFQLEQASSEGIDLQISGHTHNGQLWPLNYITDAIYEVSWGYKKKDNTHIYVSSGVGTWGPPVRIGNTPEIVNIRINFKD